ncbi:retrovirus-related pol polyprotein from transposon TNT 1-94 [Tanacetum coccineum]
MLRECLVSNTMVRINFSTDENLISNGYAVEDIGTSSSTGRHLTQEEEAKEALALRISQKFALLEEVRPVPETMAYHDKYKKVLNEICTDKELLRFPIRLEGKVNENALADTGSDINTMPYRIYEKLGREEIKKVDRGITMINHIQAESMGILTNVLCHVGVTIIIAKFLILDIPIDRDAPIVVGRGFLYTIGGIVNIPERLFLTFDGICHQTFCVARSDVLRTGESNSDDEEEYEIKRNKFGAPMYGPKPAAYLNCNDPAERSLALQAVINPFRKISIWEETMTEAFTWNPYALGKFETWERSICSASPSAFLLWGRMGCDGEIDDMLRIKLRETESNEEIFTSMAWIRAFNINEPIYSELCHEFYSTYEFDKVCADDEFQTKKIIKFRLGGRAHSLTLLEFARRLGLYHADELDEDGFCVYFQGGLRSVDHFNAQCAASGSIGSQICDLRTECASHELATMPAACRIVAAMRGCARSAIEEYHEFYPIRQDVLTPLIITRQ